MRRRNLKPEEIESILDEMGDEQAEDSECGGDSDAEDVPTFRQKTGNGKTVKTLRSTPNTPDQGASISIVSSPVGDSPDLNTPKRNPIRAQPTANYGENSEDSDDSDDSALDPDYNQEDDSITRSKTPVWRLHDVSSSEDDEEDSNLQDDGVQEGDEAGGNGDQVDDEPEDQGREFNWSKTASNPGAYSTFHFSEHEQGSKVDVGLKSPLKFFELFFTAIFLNSIVVQSNLFATQKGTGLNLTIEELRAFLGILIIMGFHDLPSMRLYWSEDLNFYVERIALVMPVKRFLKLLRFLHVNDNSQMPPRGSPNFDKLFKVRPMISHLQKCITETFFPSRHLAVDESMVPFKGRSTMKQYMPMKPVKRGFKVWVMACSITGFVMAFEVYAGKNTGSTIPGFGLGENVVLGLSSMMRGLGYILYFDNFFSSLPLLRELLSHRLFACGTLRSNRKFYPSKKLTAESRMRTGDSDFVQAGDISVAKWRDRGKKSVIVVSTLHNPSKKATVLRTNKHGERESVGCPEPIAEYNKYMGGVDKFDQLMAAYSVSWKSRRWWVKLFYYFLDMAIVNSYIMYSEAAKKARKPFLSQLQFRSTLANELIGSYSSRQRLGPSPSCGRGRKRNRPDGFPVTENYIRLADVGMHMPEETDKRRRCAYCSTKAQEKRSRIICRKCNVGLCAGCFKDYHSSG